LGRRRKSLLTRVRIQNFKSIGEPGVDLELKPLTILVGPNGGGKSSILQAIALIAQSVEHELTLSGRLVPFTSTKDIAHKGETNRWFRIGLRAQHVPFDYLFEFRPDTGEASQTLSNEKGGFIRGRLSGDRRRGYSLTLDDEEQLSRAKHPSSFLPILHEGGFALSEVAAKGTSSIDGAEADEALQGLSSNLRAEERVYMLSATRGMVPPGVGTGQSPKWVGVHGEDLLYILEFSESPTHKEYQTVRKQLTRWFARFGMLNIRVGISGPNALSGFYSDSSLRIPLNLALASQGSRQMLPVITQLFWSAPGSLVMIEEPEESLHPQAQVQLIDLFADAVKDGKQILTTTHSTLMILAMSEAVEKEVIKPDDIAVYEITKTSGGTKAKRIPLSEKGILKGWVPSFAKVEGRLLRNALNRLPKA
jgi:predicted ATPase